MPFGIRRSEHAARSGRRRQMNQCLWATMCWSLVGGDDDLGGGNVEQQRSPFVHQEVLDVMMIVLPLLPRKV